MCSAANIPGRCGAFPATRCISPFGRSGLPCRNAADSLAPVLIGIVVMDREAFLPTDPDRDTPHLIEELRARGHESEALPWRGSSDLERFDALVLRSPWDYMDHLAEFEAWLAAAESATRVFNAPELVRWNLDKAYLAHLEAAGVAVVPTRYVTTLPQVEAAIASFAGSGSRVVLKPSISAGSHDTGLFRGDDRAALALASRVVERGATLMVQPEIPELSAGAEKALYLVDGVFTHAIAKGALLAEGGALIGGVYQENPQLVEASEAELAFAGQVMDAVAEVTGLGLPLYARIDTVSTDQGILLLEAELFEPSFWLEMVPHATQALAQAVIARVGKDS